MSLGIIFILVVWFVVVFRALQYPWIGIVGYAGFAVLCPTWNWRWGLPELDYQKFLAGATLIGWMILGLRRQRMTRHGRYALLALSGYLLLSFISSLETINPLKTFLYMDTTWKIVLMAIIASLTLDSPKRLIILAWVLVISQGWNAFNINQMYYQYGINVNGFTWNHLDNNTYSISAVPVMAIAFALMVTTKHRYGSWLAGLVFVLQMHQLMILQSRGTMLGALLLTAMAVYFMPKNRTSWTFVLGGLLAGIMLAGPSVVEEFSSSFKAGESLDSSAESRFSLWKAGAAIMQDYPLLGVGPWAGEVLVPQYYEGGLAGTERKALHNLFFEVGTGSGIPALAFYLAFFGIPWWRHLQLWRKERHQMPEWMRIINLATLSGIPGFWAASMFSSGALIESPYLMVVLSVASLAVYSCEADEFDFDEEELADNSLSQQESVVGRDTVPAVHPA